MHIDRDAAELLAQVIPALLIVLVLEGRLPKPKGKPSFWRKTHVMLRNLAAFMGLGAEAACLLLIMDGNAGADYLHPISVVPAVSLLMVSIFLMFFRLITAEVRDNF